MKKGKGELEVVPDPEEKAAPEAPAAPETKPGAEEAHPASGVEKKSAAAVVDEMKGKPATVDPKEIPADGNGSQGSPEGSEDYLPALIVLFLLFILAGGVVWYYNRVRAEGSEDT